MISPEIFNRNEITERLFEIYSGDKQITLEKLNSIIESEAEILADIFYTSMLEIPDSNAFLDHEIVSERLHKSMAEWIRNLFMPMSEQLVEDYIKWQQIVGDVHSRINIPMRLVNHGIRILKWEIDSLIIANQFNEKEKVDMSMMANDLLHFASSLINESYVGNRMEKERDAQALRFHMMSMSVVVELERLRSFLFDWLRKSVTTIYERLPEKHPEIASIISSDFGLWVSYKADLLFLDQPELLEKLKNQLDVIEENIANINSLQGEGIKIEIPQVIESLSESISSTAWLLAEIAGRTLERETGRDSLTRLFNRRFLPSVMQATIKASSTNSLPFSLLMCDLDNFKQINDKYGHDIGDQILIDFGQFLVAQTRATDYVFRMGGDEFLVILMGTNIEVATRVIKKLLNNLRTNKFKVSGNKTVEVKTSIGLAVYDGHPDYMRIIKRADQALYTAKNTKIGSYFIDTEITGIG